MPAQEELTALFDREITSLERLLEAIAYEHDTLLGSDVAALEQATTAKNQSLQAHQQLAQERSQLLLKHGYSDDQAGLQACLENCDTTDTLTSALAKIRQLAERCQEDNRSNGRLIQIRQEQARGALNILRQSGDQSTVYSGQGKAALSEDSRTLGKA